MRLLSRATWLALALWAATAVGAQAEAEASKTAEPAEVGVVYRVTWWEVSDQTMTELAGKSRLSAKALNGRRLQTSEALAVSGQDCSVELARKSPIFYYDPRSTQFQVQYVNSGVQFDAKCKAKGANLFDVEVRQELARIAKHRPAAGDGKRTTSYPETDGFILEATLSDIRFGELILLGSTAGPLAKDHIKGLDPNAKAPHLVATLELEAP